MRRLQKINKQQCDRCKDNDNTAAKATKKHIERVIVPTVFSIVENAEVTLKFFNEAHDLMKTLKMRESIYFDFEAVERITVDAVMYLIALIKNMKRLCFISL